MVEHQTEAPKRSEPPKIGLAPRRARPAIFAAALVTAALVGAGATAIAQKGRAVTLVALTPEPVAALKDDTMAAVKGDVAEIFGNKFVVQDGSGRALVETGRRGEDSTLVAKGEAVTVQGRFAHGFLHAAAITHADGHADTLDPPPPHRGGPIGDGPEHGGPDRGAPDRDPRPPT